MPSDAISRKRIQESGGTPALTVAIIITTFNHAHFLSDAIKSALTQTVPADEVIVIDDGSNDDPAVVAQCFPTVRLFRQSNHGLSAARNAGLRLAVSDMIIFLDADDRLRPNAIETGLACLDRAPDCALVYGGHQIITEAGLPVNGPKFSPLGNDPFLDFVRGNVIGMHATVMYRRRILEAAGGFDVTVRRGEDYELYLRLAQQHRIACHPDTIAEYRRHGSNMSLDHRDMLRWTLAIQKKAAGTARDARTRQAWRYGRTAWRANYAAQIMATRKGVDYSATITRRFGILLRAWMTAPRFVTNRLAVRTARALLPSRLSTQLRHLRHGQPMRGHVRFGDMARVTPIDDDFGQGRGKPVDRYYVETFL